MNKRFSVLVLSLVIATGLITGCTSKESSTGNDTSTSGVDKGKKVTFSVGAWPDKTSPDYAHQEELKKAFELENPDIVIERSDINWNVQGGAPYYTAAQGGQLPNYNPVPFTEPGKMIEAGYAKDISSDIQKIGWDKNLDPSFLALVSKENKIYGVPTSAYAMGLWSNVPLFKKAGLVDSNGIPTFPTTYEQVAKYAKIIKEKTGQAGFYFPTTNNQGGWQFMNLAWSFGADFEKQVDGKWKAIFNSPEAVQALQYLKDLKWEYNVLPDNVLGDLEQGSKLFASDQVGIMISTAHDINAPLTKYSMPLDHISMSLTPAGPAGRYALVGGGVVMFSTNSTTAQVEAGLKWLEFSLGFSPDASQKVLDKVKANVLADVKSGKIVGPRNPLPWKADSPILKAIGPIYDENANVDMKLFKNFMEHSTENIRSEPPIGAQQLYQALDSVIQAVLTNKNADPKALLDKAVSNFQADVLDNAK